MRRRLRIDRLHCGSISGSRIEVVHAAMPQFFNGMVVLWSLMKHSVSDP